MSVSWEQTRTELAASVALTSVTLTMRFKIISNFCILTAEAVSDLLY